MQPHADMQQTWVIPSIESINHSPGQMTDKTQCRLRPVQTIKLFHAGAWREKISLLVQYLGPRYSVFAESQDIIE